MGLDITVLAVDWEWLEQTPAGERLGLLEDAALPEHELDRDAEPRRGWVWPAASNVPWCGRYEFHSTAGSYKPHFWAGEAWEDVRDFADPVLREHLDGFLRDLLWDADGKGGVIGVPDTALLPVGTDRRRPSLLFVCPPPAVTALAAHWARAEPLLETLREPFGVHAACPGRWIVQEHPPATVCYARDGVSLCGFGLREELWRWGQEPDLLLPELATAGILTPDGTAQLAPEDEDFRTGYRRTLGVVARRFGLSLDPAYLDGARLPAYAVRGTPRMSFEG
ncbi:hypothetical protein [Streptomyces dysideae]|uniref:hypothetical protein n=1 Tax=Streptomyces dysideae TaxID=909626 RepID=UPI000AE2536D|nr:hypothetical protein [Streptomyces dysideae]